MFQRANRSLADKKYFVLLDIAEQLNITTPRNYKQQTRWARQEIDRLEKEITQYKRKYNFLFSEADTDAERDIIIRQFIKQVFDLKVS